MAQGGTADHPNTRSLGVKRSTIYPAKNPVVTTVADPTRYTRTDAPNQQQIRMSDAADAAKVASVGVRHVPVSTTPGVTTASNTALNQPNAFTNAFGNMGGSGAAAGPKYGDVTDRMKVTENARQFGISTAADKAQNDIVNGLNQAQFDLQIATTAQGRADAQAKYNALKNYYDSGEWKSGYDKLNTMLTDNYNTGVTGLQGTYDRSQQNLNAGYDLAQGLTDQGYSALQNYLQQNPNNAYAGLQQQVQTVGNPMEQFLGAYGVSNQPVQQQVAAEQLAGQQGAGAFNTLADILNRTSQQSNNSRMAEMQMGQTMANAGLGANRANYQARNAEAQAQALAQLQQQLAQNQFGVQQNQMQAGDAARQAILNATGDFGNGVPATGGTGNGGGNGGGNDGNVYNDLVERNPGLYNPGLSPEALQAMEQRRGMAINPNPVLATNPNITPEVLQALMARRGM